MREAHEDRTVLTGTELWEVEKVDLNAVEIPPGVLAMVPRGMARRCHIIPVRFEKEAGTLVVAMADPTDLGAIEDLRFKHGCGVRTVGADEGSIDAAIDRYYGRCGISEVYRLMDACIPACESYRPFGLRVLADKARRAYHALVGRLWSFLPFRDAWMSVEDDRMCALVRQVPFVKLTNVLIIAAIGENASDIVVEISENEGKVSFRKENELREIRSFSPKVARLVMRRLRRMAGMGSRAKEGLIPIVFGDGRTIDYRVTRESCEGGERLCLQLAEDRPERAD